MRPPQVFHRRIGKADPVTSQMALFSNSNRRSIYSWLAAAMTVLAAAGFSILIARSPWTAVGAPLLVLVAAGTAAFLFVRMDSHPEERPFTTLLFCAALAIHSLASLLYNAVLHAGWMEDAIAFDRVAAVLAGPHLSSADAASALGPLAWLAGDTFTRLVADLYGLVGRSSGAVIAVNIVLEALAAYLVYRVAFLTLGPVTARFAGWLAVLFTGFWVPSLMPLKDALAGALVLLFFYSLFQLWKGLFPADRIGVRYGRTILFLALAAFSVLASMQFREYVGQVMLASASLLALVWIGRRFRWPGLAAAGVLIVLGAILLWPRFAAIGLPPINPGPDSTLARAAVIPPTGTVGGLAAWSLANPLAAAKYFLLAAGATAISPFAWIFPGMLPDASPWGPYTLAYPGMWMWYLAMPFALLGAVSAVRRSRGETLPLIFFAAILFIVFAVLIPREERHRDIIMPVALILAAEGLVYARRYWAAGLLVWGPLVLFMAWKLAILPYAVLLLILGAAVLLVRWSLARMRARQAMEG